MEKTLEFENVEQLKLYNIADDVTEVMNTICTISSVILMPLALDLTIISVLESWSCHDKII